MRPSARKTVGNYRSFPNLRRTGAVASCNSVLCSVLTWHRNILIMAKEDYEREQERLMKLRAELEEEELEE
ncbi:unnamed protein product [Callosobruchus maculatus]|uniref:Uncharacterized protein n=1 Tax=Callosobruchus maculatus TaxID=64391 RepID=A0A653CH23_CALMS|nr:unnamed protein product [Callosobruchus maculatus]